MVIKRRPIAAALVSIALFNFPLLMIVGLLPSAGAAPVVIDEFVGGIANRTLGFYDRLCDDSLAVEIPRGSTVLRAEVVLEGTSRSVPAHRLLDFSNLTMSKHLWARDQYGLTIYPPRVDPCNNTWPPATPADLQALASVDDVRWHTETDDDDCRAPYEWPLQLYHFNPVVPGATSIEVAWLGMGYNMWNTTTNLHGELYLYDHASLRWDQVANYTGGATPSQWLRHTIVTPSPYFSPNGSIDVVVAGMHSDYQIVGPAILEDQGHLYTDYVSVNASSPGGLQLPADVTIDIGGHRTATHAGPLSGEVTFGDAQGLKAALQAAIGDRIVRPGNLTLALNVFVGSITMGQLEVKGLVIEYEPPENRPPEWRGVEGVEVDEDTGWTAVMDLDASFLDDHNTGGLNFYEAGNSDEANLSIRVGKALDGNRTLEVHPAADFFGEVKVSVWAVDLFGELTLSPNITVRVLQLPDAPRIGDPGALEVVEGVPWTYAVPVVDPDLPDDNLTFSLLDAPQGLGIGDTTGELSWTAGDAQVGRHVVNVTVSDRFGLSHTRELTLVVANVNDPPVITSPLALDTVQDQPASYVIKAEDPDMPFGDQVTFAAQAEGIELMVDLITGLLSFVPGNEHVPRLEITIEAQDLAGEGAEATLVVMVENVNDPPTLNAPSVIQIDQGQAASLQLEVEDPDLGLDLPSPERHTFGTAGPEGLHADAGGWVNVTPGQGLVGDHRVTYTVTDRGGLSDSVEVRWQIRDVNDPPSVLTEVEPVVYAFEDTSFELVLEAVDLDGDAVEWSNDCPLFVIGATAGVVAFTPLQADVGVHKVRITASDGQGGKTVVAFDLEVVGMNDAPVIQSVLPENGTSFEEGDTIVFEATAVDEDDPELTYIWKEGERELGMGAVLEHSGLSAGEHNITLVVTDGDLESSTSVELTVRGKDKGPGFGALGALASLVALFLCLRRRTKA